MVARTRSDWQTSAPPGDWRSALRAGIHDLPTLCRLLKLDPAVAVAGRPAQTLFPLFAPRAWLELIQPGNPHDPLLRQILPTPAETVNPPVFCADPVGDQTAERTPGLLCKYPGRALLLTTGACAIHCRYCFRRSFPFTASMNHREQAQRALNAIAQDPSITEVILSGGDPLLLSGRSLADLLRALDAIAHLKRVRLHSRIPVVVPERIDSEICQILQTGRLPRVLVIQVNHPAELGEAAASAFRRLRATGITLLNQSVFLRGVNDSASTLAQLSNDLFAFGILPYYLHRLDRVAGGADFDIPLSRCAEITAQLRTRLPGYLMPKVVIESVGAASKTPIEEYVSTLDLRGPEHHGGTSSAETAQTNSRPNQGGYNMQASDLKSHWGD